MNKTNKTTKIILCLLSLGIVFIVGTALIGTVSAEEVIFEDDFDSYTIGSYPSSPWYNIWSGHTAYVTNSYANSDDNSFYLEGRWMWSRIDAVQIDPIKKIGYEVAVYASGYPTDARIGLYNKDIVQWGRYYAYVRFRDGKISAIGGPAEGIANYALNTWYLVRVEANFDSQKMDVYINGDLKGNQLDMGGNLGEVEYETFILGAEHYSGGCGVYYDDVKVFDLTSPINLPPVADAGPNQKVEQDSLGGASVTLDGSGSTDDGQINPLTYKWTWTGGSAVDVSPTLNLPMGLTTVTLTVDDGQYSDTDTVDITVQDTTPPVITCPADVTVEQETADGTIVPLTATATDICDASPTITSDELAIYPLGPTTVTFTATDDSGNSATCTTTVTVIDTTPPEITASGEQIVLWPPNHKYRTVEISDCVISVTDICDADVDIDDVVITSVSSDEPEDAQGKGDGNTEDDIVIVDSQTVELRAERQGGGNGRVYTINFGVTDASGNTKTGSCTVWVLHDQSGDTAVDDGPGAGYTVWP